MAERCYLVNESPCSKLQGTKKETLVRLHRLKVNRELVSQIEWKKAAQKLASTFPHFGVDNSRAGQYILTQSG